MKTVSVTVGLAGVRPPPLSPPLLDALRAQVPEVADRTVAAVIAEVPEYATAFEGGYLSRIVAGVRMAYDGFLGLLTDPAREAGALAAARRGAYLLGRDEARSHRSLDALQSAYRVGSLLHWREMSRLAVAYAAPGEDIAVLGALTMAYNHELAAASAAGHQAETAARERQRERQLERLAYALITGAPDDVLARRAERAEWSPPRTLTAVLLPDRHVRGLTTRHPGALVLPATAPDTPLDHDEATVLVPDVQRSRSGLLRDLAGTRAVVGPVRRWDAAAASYRRARQALALRPAEDSRPLDTEEHLADLVLAADPEAHHDLRLRMLAPLDDLPAATAERLAETLRCWLLHQGRRDEVAAALAVHPQTVHYRMTQVRDRFGERLADPAVVEHLMIALARVATPSAPTGG